MGCPSAEPDPTPEPTPEPPVTIDGSILRGSVREIPDQTGLVGAHAVQIGDRTNVAFTIEDGEFEMRVPETLGWMGFAAELDGWIPGQLWVDMSDDRARVGIVMPRQSFFEANHAAIFGEDWDPTKTSLLVETLRTRLDPYVGAPIAIDRPSDPPITQESSKVWPPGNVTRAAGIVMFPNVEPGPVVVTIDDPLCTPPPVAVELPPGTLVRLKLYCDPSA